MQFHAIFVILIVLVVFYLHFLVVSVNNILVVYRCKIFAI